MSPELDGRIVAIATHDDDTFVSTLTGSLYRLERAVIKERIDIFRPLISILAMADRLLTLSEACLEVFSLDLKKCLAKIELEGKATVFLHPHTYVNKILVGFASGRMQLWNFNTERLIYEFSKGPEHSVTALAQAPVVDIVAVGYNQGRVSLLDLRKDAELFNFTNKSPVTVLSFRCDAAAAETKPQLAVGGADGMLTVWNLEGRNVEQIFEGHGKAVTSLFFLPGHPILVSSGQDNSLKEWILEGEECRLLRSRSGHMAPPRIVQFYGQDGYSILSAGGDGDRSLRMNSLLKDAQSHELSQGGLESKARKLKLNVMDLRLQPITALACFTAKELKWDNLLTAHVASASARTWRVDNKRIGDHELKSSDLVTAVAVSPCGNFGLVGNRSGRVDLFNMQSGQLKRSFQCTGPIFGLAVDQLNSELLAITAEGHVQIFDFLKASKLLHEQCLSGPIEAFAFKTENGLAAFALAKSHTIEVFDLEARRVVRRLAGHSASVHCLCFSADGKWLVSAAADSTIRTWDLPSGLTLDTLVCAAAPSSVAFSPTGDFLVSVHEGDRGLHLWWNRSLLAPLRFDQTRFQSYTLPAHAPSSTQAGIVSLSSQPKSKWLSLFHLDAIKSRSRPALPEAPLQRAPFFLDAVIDAGQKRAVDGQSLPGQEPEVAPSSDGRLETLLQTKNDEETLDYLMTSGASQVHFEISALPASSFDSFLAFILTQLRTKRNFELVQTYLNVFMKAHQEYLMEHVDERPARLQQIAEAQEAVWGGLEDLLQQALCLTAFCRDRY